MRHVEFFLDQTMLIKLTLAPFVYLLKYRPRMISLNWAGEGGWDYSQICMCTYCAFWEFDIDCRPNQLLEHFVHWLLHMDCDKVVCQTQEKTNKPDSGSIYILLCNSLDLFCHICGFIAVSNRSLVNATIVLVYFV